MMPSWLDAAGFRGVRIAQRCAIVAGGLPYVYCVLSGEWRGGRFRLASLALMIVPALATALAALTIVCRFCKMPTYLFWLFGLPRGREDVSFGFISQCPYCGDDGTGRNGRPGVSVAREARALVAYVLPRLAGIATLIAAYIVLAWMGVLPG